MNLDDFCAKQNFHELVKLIFFSFFFFFRKSFYGLFITLIFRVVWFNEQPCLSQMAQFKNWWHMKVVKTANLLYK